MDSQLEALSFLTTVPPAMGFVAWFTVCLVALHHVEQRALQRQILPGHRRRYGRAELIIVPLTLVAMPIATVFLAPTTALAFVLGFGSLSWIAARSVSRGTETQSIHRLEDELPEWTMSAASSLRVFNSLPRAIAETCRTHPKARVSKEFRRALREGDLGIPFVEALERLRRRHASMAIGSLIRLLIIGYLRGGKVPSLLEDLAKSLERKRKLRKRFLAVAGVKKGEVAVLFLIGPPVFFSLMKSMNLSFSQLYADDVGLSLVAVGVAFLCIGLVWGLSSFSKRIIA